MATFDKEDAMFTFVLRREQKETLGRLAKERQTNVATIVREAVREYLAAQQQQEQVAV